MATEFQSLVETALSALDSGRSEEALAAARRAETFAHDPDDDLETLSAWNHLGTVFFRLGFTEAAERAYSIAAAGKACADDIDLQATLHNNRGQAYHRLGRLEKAHAELAEAVRIRERTHPGSRDLAITLDNLGAVEHSRGRLDEAAALHERAIVLFTRAGGHFSTDVATAIGNLGGLHAERRSFERAEACRLRALYTHLRASGPLGSETLLNAQELCSLYLKMGRMDEVDRLVEFLLSAGGREARASYRFLAEMLDALSQRAFVQHRLDLTERLATRAVELLEASEGSDSAATLKARFQRACTRRALANLDDAEAEFTALLDAFGRRGDRTNVVLTTVELAKTYRDKGGNEPARKLLESAVKALRGKEVDNREMLSSALGNLAELAHLENHNDEARTHYRAALDALEDDSRLDWPWLTHGLATVEYHLGHHDEAARLYADARRRWIELYGDKHPFVATCAANLALVHWSSGSACAALDAFREAMVRRDEGLRRQLTLGSERQRLEYARDQQGDLSRIVSFCLAQPEPGPELAAFTAEVVLRRKARVLDGIAQTIRLARASRSRAVSELLGRLGVVQAEIAQLSSPLQARGEEGVAAKLRALREEEERLETALSHEGALVETSLRETTLESVQAAIPESSVLVEYVRYKRFEPTRDGRAPWRELRYAAVVIAGARPPAWFDLGSAERIDARVNRLRDLIALSAPLGAVRNEALGLVESLLTPLEAILEGRTHWLVAPDGLLNLLPFDVLLDAQTGLDAAPLLSYLVTGRDLVSRSEGRGSGEITVLAAPDFDAAPAIAPAAPTSEDAPAPDVPARAGGRPVVAGQGRGAIRRGADFSALPGTLEEARGVQRLFPSARLIKGREATARALTAVRAPLILHIATHGVFEPIGEPDMSWSTGIISIPDGVAFISRPTREPIDPMVYSGLVFAGANVEGGAGASGIVTAREIAGVDLNGTELVVLSACETGVGHIRDGEEFSGLRRAFGIAGARSQLTSLWAVDDAATSALMVAFYEGVREGKGRIQALREAQLRIRGSQSHPEWSHPACWAAFGLSGSWGPMTVPHTAEQPGIDEATGDHGDRPV